MITCWRSSTYSFVYNPIQLISSVAISAATHLGQVSTNKRCSDMTQTRKHNAYWELHNTTEYPLSYVAFENTNFVVVILESLFKARKSSYQWYCLILSMFSIICSKARSFNKLICSCKTV
jgi:hypothetical protein